jgi:hypothetical protein
MIDLPNLNQSMATIIRITNSRHGWLAQEAVEGRVSG